MSSRFQYLLAVDLFAEDACFLETYFLETCSLETCFLVTCFLLGDGNIQKKKLFLAYKLFIAFSERGVIFTPMHARGTKA